MDWKETKVEKPDQGIELLGYHKDWVNEDTNPNGIRTCFLSGLGWNTARWNDSMDSWRTDWEEEEPKAVPTHWRYLPLAPKFI